MATPIHPSHPKSGDTTGTVLLTLISFGLLVGGLARWAQTNPTVHAALDWPTIPVLAFLADHSPDVDHFLRRSTLPTWLAVQASMVVGVCYVAGGIGWVATAHSRRVNRAARASLMGDAELAEVAAAKQKMIDKKASRLPAANDRPPQGVAATDAERLKDVFGRQPPDPPEGKKPVSLWRWLLGIS